MRIDLDKITLEELMADGGKLLVVAVLQSLPYRREYLKTNHWQDIKNRTWRLQRGRCLRTGCDGGLHDVHHNNYENVGMESVEDVEGLCRKHHEEFHLHWKMVVHNEGKKQFEPHEDQDD